MSLTSQPPRGLVKFLLRAPLRLYHAGMRKLTGNRFLILTHISGKNGQAHQVVLEVVARESETGAYFVAVGQRGNADWFQNIQENPSVKITIGNRTLQAIARVESVEDAVVTYHTYAFHHQKAFRKLSRFLVGETLRPDRDGCSRLAQSAPLVRLTPIPIIAQDDTKTQ